MKVLLTIIAMTSSLSLFANCDVENLISKSSSPNTNFQIYLKSTESGIKLYNQVVPLNDETRATLHEAALKGDVKVCLKGTTFNRAFFAYSASY